MYIVTAAFYENFSLRSGYMILEFGDNLSEYVHLLSEEVVFL